MSRHAVPSMRRAALAAPLLALDLMLPCWHSAYAQQPVESGVREDVAVEAAAPGEDAAAFATTIAGDDLASRAGDVADLLRTVPGARVMSYGGVGRYSTVSLRGSSAEQVTVVVDGVPQNRALGGAVDLSLLALAEIERLVVYRGFAPATSGAWGIGGLVDIRTRAASATPRAQIDLVGGQLGTARAAVQWSRALGARTAGAFVAERFTSRGDFDYLDTGQTPLDPRDDVHRARVNNDVATTSLGWRTTWREIGGGTLALQLDGRWRDQGVPGLDTLPAPHARLDQQLATAQVSWTWRGSGAITGVDLIADAQRQRDHFLDRRGELGVAAQDQTTTVDGGGGAAILRAHLGAHGLAARLDVRRERARVRDAVLEVSDRGGAQRTTWGVALEDAIALGRATLAPAVRWERREDRFLAAGEGALPPPAADAREARASGKLGWAFRFSRQLELRASAGSFFRAPSLVELFGDRGSIVGNPGLLPEHGRKAELGLAWQAALPMCARLTAEAVLFRNDLRDLIVLVVNPQGPAIARNIDAAEVSGVEAAVSCGLPHALAIDASGTLQRTANTSRGFQRGQDLPGRPARLGDLRVKWNPRPWELAYEIAYVGANQPDLVGDPALRLPARVLHDVELRRSVGHGWRAGLEIKNLFDRETRDVARFPLPGRIAAFNLTWRAESAR